MTFANEFWRQITGRFDKKNIGKIYISPIDHKENNEVGAYILCVVLGQYQMVKASIQGRASIAPGSDY